MSDRGVCSACGKRLIWSITPTGAKAPINQAPSDDGNVLVLLPTGLDAPLAITLSKDALEQARAKGMALRLNHFSDCEFKEQFKR